MMAEVVQRRVAAVVGALVADAAAQPLHWIYNLEKLHALVGTREDVAFWDPSANPFYTLPCGALSGYGDQAFTILKSLVDSNGFDPENLKKSTLECFGPHSKYENPVNAVYKDKADIAKKNAKYPIDGPWRHASIKEFLRNFAEGKEATGAIDDEQIDCALRVVPVVALYAGRPEMLSVAEQVIRQTQNNDLAVAVGLTAARLLEYYILHGPSDDAIDDVIRQLSTAGRSNPQELDTALVAFLREVVRKKNVPHLQATKDFTNNWHLPKSFQSTVHGMLTGSSYKTAVEGTFRAGGCNASRSGFIGACLAAQYGLENIPQSWKDKTLRYQEIIDLANRLATIQLL